MKALSRASRPGGSLPSSEAESDTNRAVGTGIVSLAPFELVVRLDVATGHLSDLADELEERQVHREVEKHARPRHFLLDVDRAGGLRRDRRHRASGRPRGDHRARLVAVLAAAGGDTEYEEALARHDAPRRRPHIEVAHLQAVGAGAAGDVNLRKV